MPSPKVSIIIPTHDRPTHLGRAIDSVRDQTYAHWELIIVVDGTLPETYAELRQQHQDLPITWLFQDQAGPGAARQHGLDAATGSAICFLDDDDYYLPEHLTRLVPLLTDGSHQIVRAGLVGEKPDGTRERYPLYDNNRPILPQYWRAPSNLMAFLFSRTAARRVPMDTVRTTVEDFTWLVRVLSHYPVQQSVHYTAVYVLHEANRSSHALAPNFLQDRLTAAEAAYAYGTVAEQTPRRYLTAWQFKQHLHYARNLFRLGHRTAGIRALRAGLRYAAFDLPTARQLAYTFAYGLKVWLNPVR